MISLSSSWINFHYLLQLNHLSLSAGESMTCKLEEILNNKLFYIDIIITTIVLQNFNYVSDQMHIAAPVIWY